MLLSACGGDSSSTATDPATQSASSTPPTSTPTDSVTPSATGSPLPAWPACSDVWQADGKIPLAYKGCLDGADSVPADNLSCSSGQRIVRYADSFFGVAGGKIYHSSGPLNKDKQYLKMVRVCRA